MRENRQVPSIDQVEHRIKGLAGSLPSDPFERGSLINKYCTFKGYEFLNASSKLHRFFKDSVSSNAHENAVANQQNNNSWETDRPEMEEEVRVEAEGTLEQISVGAMREVIKESIRQGQSQYLPTANQSYLQEFIYTRDRQLQLKVEKLLHAANLQMLQNRKELIHNQEQPRNPVSTPRQGKIDEFRKEMTVGNDGSLGSWAGKKYEGLGVHNAFSDFRREHSQKYYSHLSGTEKKYQ